MNRPNPQSLDDLSQLIQEVLKALDPETLVVGYSGGIDSSLLLHAAVRAFPADKIIALHCAHGISEHSDAWVAHCEEQARALGVRFERKHLGLDKKASEGQARDARYEFFEAQMQLQPRPVLLLGHHADDQIETLLFRWFRGTGLKGLCGIPEKRTMQSGVLYRPFLNIGKSALLSIADREQVGWVEDESNLDQRHDRNYLRNHLLAGVYQRWPKADKQILQTRELLAEADTLLDEYAETLLASLETRSEVFGQSLSLAKLKQLTKPQLSLVMRYLLSSGAHRVRLTGSDIDEIARQFFFAGPDAEPEIRMGKSIDLKRYKDRLYILINLPAEIDTNTRIDWDGKSALEISGLGVLSMLEGEERAYQVGFRAPGLKVKPLSRKHSRTLKKLMQEYELPPWLRTRMPLVFLQDQLISVGDLIRCSDHRFQWQWKN